MASVLFGPEPFTAADGTSLNGYNGLTASLTAGATATVQSNRASLSVTASGASDRYAKLLAGLNVGDSVVMDKFTFDASDVFSKSTLHRKQGTYGTGSYYAYVFSAYPDSHGISPTTSQTIAVAKQVAGTYSMVQDTAFTLTSGVTYYWVSACIGTALKVWCGTSPWDYSSWLVQTTDSSVTGTGEVEEWHGDHAANSSGTRVVTIDDFVVYDGIPSAPTVGSHFRYPRALTRGLVAA